MKGIFKIFESFLNFMEFVFSILSNLSSNLFSCFKILSSFSLIDMVVIHSQTQKLQLILYKVTAERFTGLTAEHCARAGRD